MRRVLLLLLLAFPLLAAAAPRAWLDRDSMRVGETVTLNVETDARASGEPDFSVLDADFRRLGTSSSTQLSIVNGRQSARTLWAIALEPRAEGQVQIPAFEIDGERTASILLTVLPAPAGGSAAQGDDVFLEIDAQPAAPYVQQQVSYVVRLYFAVTLLEGQLQEPQVTGAQVRRLGQDVTYQKTLNDRRYTVVERRYALVPEASGPLQIPGPRFAGRALPSGSYGNALGSNSILNARGSDVALEVRPRPASAPDPWLPAQSLTLHDESGPPPAVLKVGEPLTLTLRMAAQGLSAEQLPELQLPKIDGAEVYPDQELPTTGVDTEWLRGERVRKFAVVPTRPGRLVIPSLSVSWWDVGTDQVATTSLPARTFDVQGSAAAPEAPTLPAAAETPGDSPQPATTSGDVPQRAFPWFWPAATALFALLWLGTLAWRRRTPAPAVAVTKPAPPRIDWRRAWDAALQRGDAASAAQALILAGQSHDGRVRNLGDVATRLGDAAQREATHALEQHLYRGGSDGDALAAARTAFARGPVWRASDATPSAIDELPPLYPER